MKYALNLAEDNRILSACVVLPNGNYDGMQIVDYLPEGNLFEYRFELDENLDTGELSWSYEHDPLPETEQPETEQVPSAEERIATLEEENAALREETAMLTECVLELSSIIYA